MESGTGQLLAVRSAAEDKVRSGKYLFDKGCVLYSKLRPYLQKAAIAPFRGLCSADMYPIRTANDVLTSGFLLCILLSQEFTAYANQLSHRARMPKLNRDQLFSYELPLPSIHTQKQVVADGKNGAFITDPIEAVQAVCGEEVVFGYGTALILHGLSRYGRLTEYYVVSKSKRRQLPMGEFNIRFVKTHRLLHRFRYSVYSPETP